MPTSASKVKKKRPVRIRAKKTVGKQKKDIQKGMKLKKDNLGAPEGAGAPDVQGVWDVYKTRQANYDTLGFQLHLNQGINASGTQTKKDPNRWYELEQESERPLEAVAPKTELVRGMEAAVVEVCAQNATVPARMTFGEKDFIRALLDEHGTNYKAMCKSKLNKYQHNPGVLRRKCEKYAKIYKLSLNTFAEAYAAKR